jgi:sulfocyanin
LKFRRIASGLIAAGLLLAAGVGAFAHPAPRHAVSKFLAVNAKAKTVTLTILAGDGGNNGGMNFNGYSKGQMVITVPVGWTVDVAFKNEGSLPHSVVFDAWNAPLTSTTVKPVFAGATSPNPITGTPTGGSAKFHFKAAKVGKYRMICAFPGHAAIGMWDTFVVAKGGAPSIKF